MISDLTIRKEKHIEYILDHFDFVRVNEVMTKLNWFWFDSNNKAPSISQLKKTASKLLYDLCDDVFDECSTGGFKVIKYEDHLELLFIIGDCGSSYVNYNTPEYEKLKEQKNRKKKLNIIQKLNENEDN